MQAGDLVRYTEYDMNHKQGVEVTGVLIYLAKSRWGDALWHVRHLPPHPFTHRAGWHQPKDLEVISARV